MKKTSWLCWLLALSMLCLQAEAQYKFRRAPLPPPPLPPPQIFKKSWGPGPRMPPMGNSIHIGPNFPHKRPPLFKPPNYRFRRPPSPPAPPPSPMFNVLSNPYNKSPPLPSNLAIMSNFGSAGVPPPPAQRAPPPPPQPTPPKDFQTIGKVPQLFSPEYNRAEVVAAALQTHRAALDDDKGPIHTIPAPNLAPGASSKSYQQHQQHQQHQQQQQANKPEETPRRPYSVTQVDYATVFNGQDTGILNQRLVPSSHSTSVPHHHQYEVTESNEVNSVPPTSYFTTDFDTAHYSTSIVHEQQANDVYVSHPSSSGISRSTQQQQLESSPSMQANLHSSMHVGGGSSAAQQQQQAQGAADLHVGQPVAAGPPMSAAKLYEVLNTFPAQLTEQYTLNQQPQIQQHLLQQQLSQILQGQQDDQSAAVRATFSQPTLHSFNYEEQGSKQQRQQQQNIYIDRNYASGRVTADYSLAPEASEISQQEVNVADASEQQENNIEFESSVGFVKPTSYFTKSGGEQSLASQFYTTLPNRDAAEKLAALAAAGNVNSQLISQLRAKQQQQQSKESQQPQSDQPMPANHKDEESEQSSADRFNERQRQKPFYARQKIREEQQARWQEEKDKFQQQSQDGEDNKPLRIFVPEDGSEKEREIAADDYEYESDEADVPRENEPSSEDTNFGSRIVSKN